MTTVETAKFYELMIKTSARIGVENPELGAIASIYAEHYKKLAEELENADHKTEPSGYNLLPVEDEPAISKMEQVETMSCQECKRWIFDDRWGWFCPLKSQDECRYEPKNLEQFKVDLEYHTDTTHFGKVKGESITTNKVEDEPQTDCGWK